MTGMLFRYLCMAIYVALSVLAATIVLFLLVESGTVRALLKLHGIRHYTIQERFAPDPQLVFVPRHTNVTFEWKTKGDLYSPAYKVAVEEVTSTWTFTPDGFRKNSADGLHDLLVIGDSFIEVGESDSDTVSERIAQETGLATFNLGRGWYGPYQYLELLRRYGPESRASCALFCYFNGNDMRDVLQYEKWMKGGRYYDWPPNNHSIVGRYLSVAQDVFALGTRRVSAIRQQLTAARVDEGGSIHPSLAIVRLAGEELPMAFGYRAAGQTTDEALASAEWRMLRGVLREFRDVARRDGIQPLVVFIPTKLEVYAELVSERSGAEILEDVETMIQHGSGAAGALRGVAAELGMAFIDLLPEFKARAERGELLYYPFDSHWNSAGRQAAGEAIAGGLREQAACWRDSRVRSIR